MNYFAHGRSYTDIPNFLAGTAVPDWLSVLNRRSRTRSKAARRFLACKDQRIVAIAAGVLQHHRDDDWFHRTPAFAELSWSFTVAIRDRLGSDQGMRPSFLGHILVELLLDSELIRAAPSQLARYYTALDSLDADLVAWTVNQMASVRVENLAPFIPRFSAERFLYDYAEDAKLLFRLNHVMRRVKLPPLPDDLCLWFPEARQRVRGRVSQLLDRTSVQ